MQSAQISPELADAADVLSDQLRGHLQRMSELLEPHIDTIERRFLRRLRELGYEPKQRSALAAITSGSAARLLARNHPPLKFIEQVEYSGRRLAKLNLPPSSILEALQEYDRLLAPTLEKFPDAYSNFQWVRDQLHFCVVLTLNNAYYQVREAETQAFYELFRIELETHNLDELVRSFLETLVRVCGANAGQLYLLDEERAEWVLKAGLPSKTDGCSKPFTVGNTPGLIKKLSRPRQLNGDTRSSGVLLDPSWHHHYKSCWSIPLATDGRTAGVMQFGFSRVYEWLPREQELLAAAAERCLMAAEKARLMEDLAQREEQVRSLAEHMLHVEEIERRRISRELHDEAGQSLLCIRLQLEMIEQSLPDSEGETRGKLEEARDLTERTILEMRRLIAALSPAVLEQLGLGAALKALVNRFQRVQPDCEVELGLSKMGHLPQQVETISYRLIQECFNNIGKHSKATKVNVSLESADGVLKLIVGDNGIGFNIEDAFAKRESFGLSGMRERVALLGGKFQVESHELGALRNNSLKRVVSKLGGPKVATHRTSSKKRGTKISIELPIAK